MFCDSCGTQIQAGQSFCQRCGKAIIGTVQPGSSRVARHAQLLGILWIGYSAFTAIGAFFIMVFFSHMVPFIIQSTPPQHNGPPPELIFGWMRPFMHMLSIFLLCKAAVGIVAGIGLLQRAEWSRVLALVVGCISLINLPFGTALGIYTLWVLLSPNAEMEFRQHAVTV
jgi:zinc-ribbon domain